jgi:hypothetical protein
MAAKDTLRLWIPFVAVVMIIAAYAYFYAISATESQGSASLGIANSVGLLGVVIALFAAGFIFRRATPHR